MRTVVTGAAGFLGRAVARRMGAERYPGTIVLAERQASPDSALPITGVDLTDRAALANLIGSTTHVLHLAAVPGGTPEADPALSRANNLDVTLNLLDDLAAQSPGARIVCAGSIAVFGISLPDHVDDRTPPYPGMTYGAHKAMAEISVADKARRGDLQAMTLRLPGLVARPVGAGFRSAFTSTLVSALIAGERFRMPVGPDATMWLQSADCCAANLLHALGVPYAPGHPVITLPALRVDARTLVAAASQVTGGDVALISFAPDPMTEAQFGAYPPLDTTVADRLGFRRDGDAVKLAMRALYELEQRV